MMALLAACGGSQSAAPGSAAPDAAAPDVAGHWRSDCVPAPDGKGFLQLDFHNTTSRWQLAYTAHGDAACTQPLLVVDIEGPYEIGAASPTVAGAREAVFRFDRKTVTPKIAGLADMLNQQCGGGFAVGAAKDVSDAGCAGLGQYPKAQCGADYDVVARDGDALRFGQRPANNDLCTPAHRPTALAPLVLHRAS